MDRESIVKILQRYNCQYTCDEDENPLSLVDVLSSGDTIKEGLAEVELIADAIAGELEYVPSAPVRELVAAARDVVNGPEWAEMCGGCTPQFREEYLRVESALAAVEEALKG